jgi:transposase
MSKKRREYTREFKLEALRLWESSGKSAAQIEEDLGLTRGRLYRWKTVLQQAGDEAFPGHGRQVGMEEELRRLRRELEITRQERDILKEAVGIFAAPKKRDSRS